MMPIYDWSTSVSSKKDKPVAALVDAAFMAQNIWKLAFDALEIFVFFKKIR